LPTAGEYRKSYSRSAHFSPNWLRVRKIITPNCFLELPNASIPCKSRPVLELSNLVHPGWIPYIDVQQTQRGSNKPQNRIRSSALAILINYFAVHLVWHH
jgi:hypothetical protein